MMRLWFNSYARPTLLGSSATISVAVHAVILGAWIFVTLPPSGMPMDGVANRVYPTYIPPPDRGSGGSGSRESIHYVKLPQTGEGIGDGPRTIGDERPGVADESIGIAPVDSVATPPAPEIPGPADSVFTVVDVDSAVARAANSASPAYPAAMLSAHVMGSVVTRYVVDTTGRADSASFKVLESTNPQFEQAVRAALPGMRFTPAKIGSMKVRQLVEQTFSFQIAEPVPQPPATAAGGSAAAGSTATEKTRSTRAPPVE